MMIKTFTLSLLLAYCSFGQFVGSRPAPSGFPAPSAQKKAVSGCYYPPGSNEVVAASYFYQQDFEGVGRPAEWINNGGSATYDYTASPLVGSESLNFSSGGQEILTTGATASTAVDIYFTFSLNGTVSGGAWRNLVALDQSIFGNYGAITITDGNKLLAGGSIMTLGLTSGSTYHCWIKFIPSTSIEVWVNDSATKPASDSDHYDIRTGITIATLNYLPFFQSGAVGCTFDKVRFSYGTIGSNPL